MVIYEKRENMKLKPQRVTGNILTTLLNDDERLVVLMGARQGGKTSIMQLLMDKLLNVKRVEKIRQKIDIKLPLSV
jgi:predicted AAA+ superfamily ATPase